MKRLLSVLILVCATSFVFAQQNGAKFSFKDDNATFDFGKIKEGQKVTHDFVFTNTGNQPLQILKVEASCGCTTPDWPKRPILPGKSDKISVTYNSNDNVGKVIKEISVQSNAVLENKNQRRTVITLKGEVTK